MQALFSGLVGKIILFLLGVTVMSNPAEKRSVSAPHNNEYTSIRNVTIVFDADTTESEREKAREELEAERKKLEEEREKAKQEARSLKISITDKGLKVGSDEGGEVEFTVDLEGIDEAIDEKLRALEIPDSIIAYMGDEDERRFIGVRGKDLVRFGEEVHIPYFELVRGNVVVIGGDLRIDGKVMGDVVNIFGRTTLSSSAIVNGEVVTIMGELSRADDATIGGETILVGGEGFGPVAWPMMPIGHGFIRVISQVVGFIIAALLLLIVIYFLSDRMKRSSTLVFGSFLKSLGVGFLVVFVGSILAVVLAVILAITIVGIPVSILIILSLIALIVMGYFVSALALGRFISSKFNLDTDSTLLQGLLGLFALVLLGLISSIMFFNPFLMPVRVLLKNLGNFVNFLAVITGVGAFVLSRAGSMSTETKPELPA
jgi:hypothetical protein